MRAMPLSLPGKLLLGVSAGVSPASLWKEGGRFDGEPTSVLDTRPSPSPPTSTSTLSGGGGGDSAGVAAVSESLRWQDVAGGEWAAAELGMEVMGGEKCGLGMDDCWEEMTRGCAAVSPRRRRRLSPPLPALPPPACQPPPPQPPGHCRRCLSPPTLGRRRRPSPPTHGHRHPSPLTPGRRRRSPLFRSPLPFPVDATPSPVPIPRRLPRTLPSTCRDTPILATNMSPNFIVPAPRRY